jgi:hypothetical protein
MIETEEVSETLGFYPQLTRHVAREDFIEFIEMLTRFAKFLTRFLTCQTQNGRIPSGTQLYRKHCCLPISHLLTVIGCPPEATLETCSLRIWHVLKTAYKERV